MATIAKCRTCGKAEDLAEPFIDGVCTDCLRKASGVSAKKPTPRPVAAVAGPPPPPVQPPDSAYLKGPQSPKANSAIYVALLAVGLSVGVAGTMVVVGNRESSSDADAKQATSQASLQELNERYKFEVDEYKKLSDIAVKSITSYCEQVDHDIEENVLSGYFDKLNPDVAKTLRSLTATFRVDMNKAMANLDEQNKRVESAVVMPFGKDSYG